MPMTLKQLQLYTTRDRALLSREVQVTGIQKKMIKPAQRRKVIATTFSPFNPKTGARISKPPRYKTEIESLAEENKPISKSYVRVSCSCGDWWSHWEYAVNKKGAAEIKYSNGEPPVVTNPSMIPGMCKHLYALARIIQASNW